MSTFFASCTSTIRRSPNSLLDYITDNTDDDSLSERGIKNLKDEYDVVCIGSGYGASVVAARLSKQYPNANICILERGREFKPGDFPKTFPGVLSEIKSKVNPTGLLDQTLGKSDDSDLDIISASGLGGTSLINAAIGIRPLLRVFEQPEWPSEIRGLVTTSSGEDLGGLDRYFKKAEHSLETKKNEYNISKTKKSIVFAKAVKKLSVSLGFLPLNIKYSNNTKYNVDRADCTMCGDCCSGCNVGAKNILPYNYLHEAKSNQCEIFTNSEVKSIKKLENGYEIVVVDPSSMNIMKKTIKAKNVVLGAGSHGSTGLLLKAQKNGLSLSKTLGTRLSLNADVLGFCYNGHNKTQAIGIGTSKRKSVFQSNVGPGISTFANYREKHKNEKLEKQYLLLEGSIPSPLTGVVASALAQYAHFNKDQIDFSPEQWERVNRDKKLIPNSSKLEAEGALNYSTLFLACGHDSSGGRYELDKSGNLKVVYKDVIKEEFYETITEKMKEVSKNLGGVYLDNPRTTIFKDKMMATHPLGGCPMGDTHKSGVVNHKGQVFSKDGNLHKGLYVVDAAIIPRSLGATPLLTISALAERISEKMIEDEIV